MSKKNQESNEKSVKKDTIVNIENNLKKDENTMEVVSFIQMVTDLLKDKEMQKDVEKLKENKSHDTLNPAIESLPEEAASPTKDLDVQAELHKHLSAIRTLISKCFSARMNELTQQLVEIQGEITDLKLQNKKLTEQVLHIKNNYKEKKKDK